ncbi:hypothetical protein SBDP1_370035 [Syntrophobacter sp. SbD1]|nr:hypothetical protein SBDP1_370035 [Syntrophobacter sp. SbD1]
MTVTVEECTESKPPMKKRHLIIYAAFIILLTACFSKNREEIAEHKASQAFAQYVIKCGNIFLY